jgi:hypothetical protein
MAYKRRTVGSNAGGTTLKVLTFGLRSNQHCCPGLMKDDMITALVEARTFKSERSEGMLKTSLKAAAAQLTPLLSRLFLL